ncbi:MAG: ParB/RepB/Spo0J family partition protein [Planctomycetia bacterium]|nr:ParB/RepB/Spo0J family partition protein [Planctomycetia bacterium]
MAIELVPLSRIEIRSNVRDRLVEDEQIALAESIRQNGIQVPCIGYEDGAFVVPLDGHRRIDAAPRAGLDAVPMCVLDHPPSHGEAARLQLVINCYRADLKPTERGRAYERLMTEFGVTAAELASHANEKSEATISKLVAILVLPKPIQDLIDAGRIPISSGYALATVNNSVEREQLVAGVLDGRLKRDQLVKLIKSRKRDQQPPRRPRQAKRPPRERVTMPLGAGRAITVAGPELSVDTLITWLDQLLNRIKRINAPGVGLKDLATLLRPTQTAERKSD